METKNKDTIFTINKDPVKEEFIKSHTFDKIKQYIPEQNISNSKKNKNLINQNNLNIDLLEKICQKNEKIKIKIILN